MQFFQKAFKGVGPLAFLIVLNVSSFCQSNEGQDFWFAFMEHLDVGQNNKVVMITSKNNTSGVVSIPRQGWSQSFSVTANQVQLITLPAFAETRGSEQNDNTGVRVTSLLPVSVYMHQYFNFRSEASLVLPTNSIGNEYYILTYAGFSDNNNNYPSEFIIAASEDDTNISITVSDNTKGGKPPGTTFAVHLDAGETYQVQGAAGSDDLTGSYIVGDKDFAVLAGCRWTEVPTGCNYRDNLLEQMYAVSTWGRQFVTAPHANVYYDKFRIIAGSDNTLVEVFGNTMRTFNLDAGEFAEYDEASATYIRASKPIMIAEFLIGSGCNGYNLGDPSMLLLNSLEQTRDTVTLYNSRFQDILENYINIIITADDAPFITVDGQPLESLATINTVGLNDEFAFATLEVAHGAHTIISEGCGIIASAYGYGNLESYAYGGGASFKKINANPIVEGGCLNDTIIFDTGLSPARYTFEWDLGDGTTSTEASFQHFYPQLGSYPVQLILTDECLNISDTLYRDLIITLRQSVDALDDINVCEGASIQLGATDLTSAQFEWRGPNNFFSDIQFPAINQVTSSNAGTYEVIGIISGCATFPATIEVVVNSSPQPDLGPDTIICTQDLSVVLNPGDFTLYHWQNGSGLPTQTVVEEGTFSVTVTDENGCQGEDQVELTETCPTRIYVPNAFSPNDDGINDGFRVYGTDIISMELSVFSRWGELVFKSTDLEKSWDGKFRDRPLPSGIFAWMLVVEGYRADGSLYSEVISGDVLLVK